MYVPVQPVLLVQNKGMSRCFSCFFFCWSYGSVGKGLLYCNSPECFLSVPALNVTRAKCLRFSFFSPCLTPLRMSPTLPTQTSVNLALQTLWSNVLASSLTSKTTELEKARGLWATKQNGFEALKHLWSPGPSTLACGLTISLSQARKESSGRLMFHFFPLSLSVFHFSSDPVCRESFP